MSVRYANIIGLTDQHSQTEVFANRGTSGIDGSSSTAVGGALASDQLTVLITGDLAFFYTIVTLSGTMSYCPTCVSYCSTTTPGAFFG